MSYRLLPEAQKEVTDAEAYYERERRGLGKRYAKGVRETIREVAAHPTFSSQIRPGFWFRSVKKFPYIVIYTIEEQGILVVAVAHERREFGYWQDRLPTP